MAHVYICKYKRKSCKRGSHGRAGHVHVYLNIRDPAMVGNRIQLLLLALLAASTAQTQAFQHQYQRLAQQWVFQHARAWQQRRRKLKAAVLACHGTGLSHRLAHLWLCLGRGLGICVCSWDSGDRGVYIACAREQGAGAVLGDSRSKCQTGKGSIPLCCCKVGCCLTESACWLHLR